MLSQALQEDTENLRKTELQEDTENFRKTELQEDRTSGRQNFRKTELQEDRTEDPKQSMQTTSYRSLLERTVTKIIQLN